MAEKTTFIGNDRLDDAERILIFDPKNSVLLPVLENREVVGADLSTDFFGLGRLEDRPVGVKNPYIEKPGVLSDPLQNSLNLFALPGPHGIKNGFFDSRKEQGGIFLGQGDQMIVLATNLKKRKDPYAKSQEQDIQNDNATDKALKKQYAP
jgi:hypothetical protein